jgi:cytochrome bd-type quinol oxidase subunit 2
MMSLQGKTSTEKYLPFILSACLMIGCCFLAGAAFSQTTADGGTSVPSGITPGRARTIVIGVVGLISLVAGWMAKARNSRGAGSGRSWAIPALVLGLVCATLSVLHLATVKSGFGTGSGKAGAIVALLLGLSGMALAGMALRPKQQ